MSVRRPQLDTRHHEHAAGQDRYAESADIVCPPKYASLLKDSFDYREHQLGCHHPHHQSESSHTNATVQSDWSHTAQHSSLCTQNTTPDPQGDRPLHYSRAALGSHLAASGPSGAATLGSSRPVCTQCASSARWKPSTSRPSASCVSRRLSARARRSASTSIGIPSGDAESSRGGGLYVTADLFTHEPVLPAWR